MRFQNLELYKQTDLKLFYLKLSQNFDSTYRFVPNDNFTEVTIFKVCTDIKSVLKIESIAQSKVKISFDLLKGCASADTHLSMVSENEYINYPIKDPVQIEGWVYELDFSDRNSEIIFFNVFRELISDHVNSSQLYVDEIRTEFSNKIDNIRAVSFLSSIATSFLVQDYFDLDFIFFFQCAVLWMIVYNKSFTYLDKQLFYLMNEK